MSYRTRYPLARTSTVKEELVAIKIELQSVMDCDPSYMLNLLKNVISTREQVVAFEGRIAAPVDLTRRLVSGRSRVCSIYPSRY